MSDGTFGLLILTSEGEALRPRLSRELFLRVAKSLGGPAQAEGHPQGHRTETREGHEGRRSRDH